MNTDTNINTNTSLKIIINMDTNTDTNVRMVQGLNPNGPKVIIMLFLAIFNTLDSKIVFWIYHFPQFSKLTLLSLTQNFKLIPTQKKGL
jgi:hypothetical protein